MNLEELFADEDSTAESDLDLPYLSKYSERDAKFDRRKYESMLLSELFFQAGYPDRATKLDFCGRSLTFAQKQDDIRLKFAIFCKDRFCSLCNFRKAKIWRKKIIKIIPKLFEKYPNINIASLVLTVRNPSVFSLSETLNQMSRGWNRMQRLKTFPALGYIISTEFSRSFNVFFPDGKIIRIPNKDFKTFKDLKYCYSNRDDLKCRLNIDIHPHFHILLFLPHNYYYEDEFCYNQNIRSSMHLSQKDYQLLWKKSLRINYDPIIWINPVYPRNPYSNNPHFSSKKQFSIEDLINGFI
jgi:plasmid rolling circle replication initiator protein Rep